MKKLFIIALLICTTGCAFAKNTNPTINHAGKKYKLLYSTKNNDYNGYMNEYYTNGEGYETWSSMLTIHHFPNINSPIEQAQMFQNYLDSINCETNLIIDKKHDKAILDFTIINKNKLPIIIEYNVFKYEKSEQGGVVAMQYVKRYTATTSMQEDATKIFIKENKKAFINSIKNKKIPNVISKFYDYGKEIIEEDKILIAEDIDASSTEINKQEKEINIENDIEINEEKETIALENEIENNAQENIQDVETNLLDHNEESEKNENDEIQIKSDNIKIEEVIAIHESTNEKKSNNIVDNDVEDSDNKVVVNEPPINIQDDSINNIDKIKELKDDIEKLEDKIKQIENFNKTILNNAKSVKNPNNKIEEVVLEVPDTKKELITNKQQKNPYVKENNSKTNLIIDAKVPDNDFYDDIFTTLNSTPVIHKISKKDKIYQNYVSKDIVSTFFTTIQDYD